LSNDSKWDLVDEWTNSTIASTTTEMNDYPLGTKLWNVTAIGGLCETHFGRYALCIDDRYY